MIRFSYNFICFTFFGCVLLSCNSNSPDLPIKSLDTTTLTQKEELRSIPISVSTNELCGDFANDKQYANEKYSGNKIRLSGTLVSVQQPSGNECGYITMNCSDHTDNSEFMIKSCMESGFDFSNISIGSLLTLEADFKEQTDNIILLENAKVIN